MDVEERKLLEAFLSRLVGIAQIGKDRAAAALIESAFERQPNAAYLVVQRALILERALEASRSEVARLQHRLAQAQAAGSAPSFLGSDEWDGATGAPAADAPAAGRAARANDVGPAQRPPPSRRGGFLGPAAIIAAGATVGAFLFHGVDALASSCAPARTPFDHADPAPALGPGSDGEVPAAAEAAAGSASAEASDVGVDFELGTDSL